MLETGKLRQPLSCPKWRVSQEECLALPPEHRLSTSLEDLKSPDGQGAVKPVLLSSQAEPRPAPRAPLLAEPLPGYPGCASSTKTSGLFLFFPEVQREALISPDAPAFIKNFS